MLDGTTPPPTVNSPTTTTSPQLSLSEKNANQSAIKRKVFNRKIHAEDKEWNISSVKKLTDICLKVMVGNFSAYPILDVIPMKYRNNILSNLPTDLPLALASQVIANVPTNVDNAANYWQRRALEMFPKCDLSMHGDSWKRLFFEKHCESLIQVFTPQVLKEQTEPSIYQRLPSLLIKPKDNIKVTVVDEKHLLEQFKIAAPYVKNLIIEQLKTNIKDEQGVHIDMRIIFDNLTNLNGLQLYYGVQDCGVDFEWKLFGMKEYDCESLAAAMRTSNLKRLIIQFSRISDAHIIHLSSALMQNEALEYLDLSHNLVSDSGTEALAKYLSAPKSSLKTLSLSNNKLTSAGITHLLAPLSTKYTQLRVLLLGMNLVNDDVGEAIFTKLMNNRTLEIIDLSATQIGIKTIKALGILLSTTSSAQLPSSTTSHSHTDSFIRSGLKEIILCCNTFNGKGGKVDRAGKVLYDSVSTNKSVTLLDLRGTDVSTEFLESIQSICKDNKFSGMNLK